MTNERTELPTTTIDVSDPEANMYGCSPCFSCGSIYRYPVNEGGKSNGYRKGDIVRVRCDDCGKIEIARVKR